jgi:chromate transporter
MPTMTLREATKVWLRIGLLSFGGPAGQIALMHDELVEKRKWISDARFLHALSFCTLLPGPEAMQLATYIGWLMHRTPGALVAGGLFVLPGALVLLVLSAIYATLHKAFVVEALFFGLKAAVIALVAQAVIRVGRRALKRPVHVACAAVAFFSLLSLDIPYPLVVLGMGALGAILGPRVAPPPEAKKDAATPDTLIDAMESRGELLHTLPSNRRTATAAALGALAWAGPLVVVTLVFGASSLFAKQARFFSEAAVVTFGGAYAVLGFVAQQAVQVYGWLEPKQMVDGLGLAETTPGPLILVLVFVGFVGAYQHAAALPPLVAGTLGGAITLWATFAPCFVWVFIGGPWVEALRGNARLRGALSLITAVVVGVIAQLSLWFAVHTLFADVGRLNFGPVHLPWPTWSTVQWGAVGLCTIAVLLLFRLKLGLGWVLAACSAGGLVWRLVT